MTIESMADTMDTYDTVTPYLVVPDADLEIRFLEAAFGATVRSCHRGEDGTVMHAEIVVGSSLLMLGQANGPWKPLTAAHYVWVPEVDRVYGRALEAGATSQSAPADQSYGHRMGGVVDANGLTWWIASPVAA
jgi:PhnB protein